MNADETEYHLGNQQYRQGNWKAAIEHYLKAQQLNPLSPATEKLKMVYGILEFYNKDIYGQ